MDHNRQVVELFEPMNAALEKGVLDPCQGVHIG